MSMFTEEKSAGGRCWFRTSDPCRVKALCPPAGAPATRDKAGADLPWPPAIYTRVYTALAAACLGLAACGGSVDEPSCGSATAERVAVAPGQGAALIVRDLEITPSASPRRVTVSLVASRLVQSDSGLDLGPPGAVASYHFMRVYRDGRFAQVLPGTDRDDFHLPVPAGSCIEAHHVESALLDIPAGEAVRVEAVWSLVRPRTAAQDLTAITESFRLSATGVHQ